jgi:hypothetical protein
MDNAQFTCPVCNDCDHDVRSGVLVAIEKVGDNLKQAGELLLDAIEAPGTGAAEFGAAVVEFHALRRQMTALAEFAGELALIKEANAQ